MNKLRYSMLASSLALVLIGAGCGSTATNTNTVTTNTNTNTVTTTTNTNHTNTNTNPTATAPANSNTANVNDTPSNTNVGVEVDADADADADSEAAETETKTFDVVASQFEFTPSTLTVNEGDTVVINLTTADAPHGFSLPDFDVNATITPGKTKTVEFVADHTGTFSFSCSVVCGSGHSSMRGSLVVN